MSAAPVNWCTSIIWLKRFKSVKFVSTVAKPHTNNYKDYLMVPLGSKDLSKHEVFILKNRFVELNNTIYRSYMRYNDYMKEFLVKTFELNGSINFHQKVV